ncbi:hypothetical protein [Brevundimonas sp.]|uniref:hypothetical protein n=1 Tax=Brevundimonas sp. TaxID=1871086 RepID=UPI0039E5ECB6
MLPADDKSLLGFSAFSVFAVLAGLTLLVGANHASPGCTGPAVKQCDYVAVAKAAASAAPYHYPFQPDRGFDIFDQGSSVLVQATDEFSAHLINHGSSVLIDKKSCRPCVVSYHYPDPVSRLDYQRGALIQQIPPEDPVAAAERLERIRAIFPPSVWAAIQSTPAPPPAPHP